MDYGYSVERDSVPLNTDPILKTTPETLPENSSKKAVCTIENLTCSYLYDGLQPLDCEHCHS